MSAFALKLSLKKIVPVDFVRLKSYFITTPIFYVNASPHLGHLHSAILADACHRYKILRSAEETIFSVGTDEHGTKIQQAASNSGIDPAKYCHHVTSLYKSLFEHFNISYTDFIHTSEERHKKTVQFIWQELVSKNLISKGSYSGWYCDADEAFLSEDQLETITKNGEVIRVSSESGRPVHWVEESNYNFDLAPFRESIEYWIKSDGISPKIFNNRLLTWLSEGVTDRSLSISRPSSRVYWGIPVPGDPNQTIYVWLDALINYLTVAGYPDLTHWPPDNQIIGKDILKFHGIYWPGLLFALGLEPPKCLNVHSHWTVDNVKMSKSLGNVLCPIETATKYTVDGLRYFLLREAVPHSDSNFSNVKVVRVLNSELADTLGNLLNRCCGNTVNKWQTFPEYSKELFDQYCCISHGTLINELEILADEVSKSYDEMNFYKGIARIMSTLHKANQTFETAKPWELRKSPASTDHLLCIIHLIMESLRISAICLQPIIPNLSDILLTKLAVPKDKRNWTDAVPSWKANVKTESTNLDSSKVVLYRKIV